MNTNDKISKELLETIERYLNGKLSSQELRDFERLLDLDEEFRVQVDDVRTMLLGVEAQSLKEQLDEFHQEIPISKKTITPQQKTRFLRYSQFAAAAAILIAVGGFWFFSTSNNERLYSKYFEPDPGLPTTMSSTNNYDFYDGMVKYKYGNYDLAISKWKALIAQTPENDTLNYFLGVAKMVNKNTAEAIPFLEHAIEAPDDFVFLNEAYYYLGLAYLKEGNIELAKKNFSLSKIKEARELFTKLDH